MPCKICRKIGHNSRTCPTLFATSNASQVAACPVKISTPPSWIHLGNPQLIPTLSKEKKYYCYILKQTNMPNALNYVGYTVNYNHRLRQHCGLIKGGAVYTRNKGPWEFLAVMYCPSWDKIRALQVEWLTKHPTRKRKRPRCFSGCAGRIKSLIEIFNRIPPEENINIYIHPDFRCFAESLNFPENVKIIADLCKVGRKVEAPGEGVRILTEDEATWVAKCSSIT